MKRISEINRKTNETNISLKFNIDGIGDYDIDTGVGFFDHMMTHISKHGLFDLDIKCRGDLEVDCHHTIEDIGIVFGKCIKEAIGDKKGIKRYGSAIIPMDETLVLCALDLSGRSYLNYDVELTTDIIGTMDTEMVEEFFRAVSMNAEMNLHIKLLDGKNNHHIVEGIFKAFGNALDQATIVDSRIKGTLTTKGVL
ncbi:imidazoleglycerol-phosphate dehydratase HisB [Vallitalea sp.]|jgi:imidazoleglycerol-phosphate dehydratase|uniref:imidazoleglycerol-phosphate dehydratase HisB n=1 Tax=Vallitalea sp. TaxID=1882829 RepID=UPI0025E5572F|nr:imidazoleglycerol-phosphate dehydratase HisB [Vallitalea sp.]MCT4688032.1 imidazoleglycerol-phosphate dehydratase HisB [Vallitalea sp.]